MAALTASQALAVDLNTFDQIQEKRRQLEAEEQSINRMYQNNDELSQRVGLIRHIQEKILKGPGGVLERTAQWFSKADNWLAQWKSLIKSAQSIKSSDVEKSAKDFEAGFEALDNAFDKLFKDSVEIRNLISQVRSELLAKDPLPEQLNPSKREHIAALNAQQGKILDFLVRIENAFIENTQARFEDQVTKIRDYITLQLRNMRLNFPQLREQIERTEKKIAYVADFQAVYGKYRRQAMEVEGMVADFQLFEAEENLKKMADERESIKKTLADSKITGQLLTDSYRLIDEVYERAESALTMADEMMPRSLSFYTFVDLQRSQLSEDCRDVKLRALRDCELLAVLNRVKFDPEKIESWKKADMAFFEKQLVKVRKGPGLGQENK
jgi:hypothetical protein